MAPLITITIKALLGSVGLQQNQPPITHSTPNHILPPIDTSNYKPYHQQTLLTSTPHAGPEVLSAISWGEGRNAVFGTNPTTANLSHKWWDGSSWHPDGPYLEDLGGPLGATPVAVTWGNDRADVFSQSTAGELIHKYFFGGQWSPDVASFEHLGGSLTHGPSTLTATTWGEERLDVFGIDAGSGGLAHKFWDGSQWNPQDGTEDLGGRLGAVSAVSWGEGRLDVFAVDESAALLHLYYDGTKWSNWETFPGPAILEPTAVSWGVNRLDVFAIGRDTGSLLHIAWDGSQWLPWEDLGGSNLVGPPAAISWGPDRIDIVALGGDGVYYYKFWDGYQWNPIDNTLYPKGANFTSVPALSSWGVNRLDIFGVTAGELLAHQTWYGSGWYPEWTFETLGGPVGVPGAGSLRVHREL